MTQRQHLRFALDRHRNVVSVRLAGLENPHTLIVGGSQSGKTTTEKVLTAEAGAAGCITLVLDPKLRFGKHFRNPRTGIALPHVPVYRNVYPDQAAREWEQAVRAVHEEMQRRYRIDDESPTNVLHDTDRFPTIILMIDEFGTLVDFARQEWATRKEQGDPAEAPINTMLQTIFRMGAEARVLIISANQASNADELPAGTKTRQLNGQRLILGTDRDDQMWAMIAGWKTPKPEVPSGQRGAGNFIVGTRDPIRVQCAFMPDSHLYDHAAQGMDVLARNGHIDSAGRLLLSGVEIPRPGAMPPAVTATATGPEQPCTAGSASLVPEEQTIRQARETVPAPAPQRPEPAPRLVIGLQNGAEFCGMSYSNFRKHRSNYPISEELQIADRPGWPKTALYEWAIDRGAQPETDGMGDAA